MQLQEFDCTNKSSADGTFWKSDHYFNLIFHAGFSISSEEIETTSLSILTYYFNHFLCPSLSQKIRYSNKMADKGVNYSSNKTSSV